MIITVSVLLVVVLCVLALIPAVKRDPSGVGQNVVWAMCGLVLGFVANIWLASQVLQMEPGFYSMAGVWAIVYFTLGWVFAMVVLEIFRRVILAVRNIEPSSDNSATLGHFATIAGYYIAFFFVNGMF